MRFDYLVIGAGIVGLATAHRLQRRQPGASVAVVEKESQVAAHQSGHNSGVIHAGVYYAPGSLKAQLCRAGARATMEFCREHGVPYRQCGKLIVATSRAELTGLHALATRAAANGLSCELLDAAAIAQREPAVSGIAALHVPDTGIADYPALCRALARLIERDGGKIHFNSPVEAIGETAEEVTLSTAQASLRGRRLVVCGGLQADRLARLAGLDVDFAIVPFRGDYFELPPARATLINSLIYPVPDPALPFLGVHLTLTTAGGITIGPSAMLAFARETYTKWALDRRDSLDLLRFGGTWRLLARYPRAGLVELLHAASRRAYLQAARQYCPGLALDDLAVAACGIRAQAVHANGDMVQDFLFRQTPRSVHVCNAPSPAATSAFPIAEAIVERLGT